MTAIITEEQARSQASTLVQPILPSLTADQATNLINDVTAALLEVSKHSAHHTAKHLGQKFRGLRKLMQLHRMRQDIEAA